MVRAAAEHEQSEPQRDATRQNGTDGGFQIPKQNCKVRHITLSHQVRRERRDTHIKEGRGIEVDIGLPVEDGLQVLQAAVDVVQVLAQLAPGA